MSVVTSAPDPPIDNAVRYDPRSSILDPRPRHNADDGSTLPWTVALNTSHVLENAHLIDNPTAKVLFRVPDDDGDAMVETLWAVPLGGDHYQLANSPFYAYNVSWDDVVFAPFDDSEGLPTFQSVVQRSGNRTVRVKFDLPVISGNASDEVGQGLITLGCSYEGASAHYLSVNIPAEVDLHAVCSYLIQHETQWEHADPCYATIYPDDEDST